MMTPVGKDKISNWYLNYITKFEGIIFIFKKVMRKNEAPLKIWRLLYIIMILNS